MLVEHDVVGLDVAVDKAARVRVLERTRDRPQLIFTISGAYIDGAGLWTVEDQVIAIGGPLPPDHLFLSRSVTRTIGAGFSAT